MWSLRYNNERYAIAMLAPGTRLFPHVLDKMNAKVNRFYDSGGSIEIHDLSNIQSSNADMQQQIMDNIAQMSSIRPTDETHRKAISNTIKTLTSLHNAYGMSDGIDYNNVILLAKHDGNVVGGFTLAPIGNTGYAGIRAATSIYPAAATALNHAAIKHYLAPRSMGVDSRVYSNQSSGDTWGRPQQRTRDNAQRYHEELGRRVGWGTALDNYPTSPGNWSMWTPEDVQKIDSTLVVPNERVTLL